MGIEGVAAGDLDPNLPPLVSGGRPAPVETSQARSQPVPPSTEPERAETSLMVHSPVRSGQAIFFPSGDVTIIGSVASGAEVIAGGSIHIYGTLRGRAMAGTSGNRQARIFCSRIAAELLAIDGYYRTAESLEAELRNKPIQAWLEGETLIVAAME
jgi:septum site-determining protein MinC